MGLIEPDVVLNRHRLTVDDYYRMAETGVLAPDARVELIEGELVDMASIGTRHAASVKRLLRLLSQTVGDLAIVSVQDPLRLSTYTETQPDLTLLKPRDDFYLHAPPLGPDALLVIEVADSSASYDRRIKAPLYARHGVPECWIIDLDAGCVRILRAPQDGEYRDATLLAAPGRIDVQALPGISLDLSTLLQLLTATAPR